MPRWLWRTAHVFPTPWAMDGFHALKHALRFGADVRLVVTSDKQAVLGLAAELADDLTDVLNDSVIELPAQALSDALSSCEVLLFGDTAGPSPRKGTLAGSIRRMRQ